MAVHGWVSKSQKQMAAILVKLLPYYIGSVQQTSELGKKKSPV
jgi:hypothetical protein